MIHEKNEIINDGFFVLLGGNNIIIHSITLFIFFRSTIQQNQLKIIFYV